MGALQNLRPRVCTFHERILGAVCTFHERIPRGACTFHERIAAAGRSFSALSKGRTRAGRRCRRLFRPASDCVIDSISENCRDPVKTNRPILSVSASTTPCKYDISSGAFWISSRTAPSAYRPRKYLGSDEAARRTSGSSSVTYGKQDCQNCFLQEPIVTSWPQRAKERRRSFRTARAVTSPSQLAGAFHTATSG